MDSLCVDREFAALCEQQTPEELNLLEQSLLAHGCLDPIITWANHDDTILDGHTRHRLCEQLGVSFKTKALKFDSREDARNWIIDNQLGRRNLSEERKAYLRGKRYLAEKKSEGSQPGNSNRKQLGHDVPVNRTSAKLADQFGVTEKTIRRDAKFSDAVDTIGENVGSEVKSEILSGRSGLSKKKVVAIAKEPAEKQATAVEIAKRDAPKDVASLSSIERLVERIEQVSSKVDSLAAIHGGHNEKSRALKALLTDAAKMAKAMGRSWRNL